MYCSQSKVGHVVFPAADVITHCLADRRIEGGWFFDAEPFLAEQFEYRPRMLRGEKFSLGIGPLVLHGTGDIDHARSNEGDELMLVHR